MYQLRVLNGIHEGLCLELDQQPVLIGSKENAGLRLSDPGIAGLHALALLTETTCLLSAIDAQLGAADKPFSSIRLGFGQCTQVGPVWLMLDQTDVKADPARIAAHSGTTRWQRYYRLISRYRWVLYTVSLASVMLAISLLQPARALPSEKQKPLVEQKLSVKLNEDSSMKGLTEHPVMTANQLQQVFRDRLDNDRLLHRFSLDFQEQRWSMKASLDDDEQRRFERLLLLFVREFDVRFPFNAKITHAAEILPFKVQQVIFGDTPSLVTNDGQRLYVGDEYRGFRLTSIAARRLSFAGKRKLVIDW